MTTKPAYTPAQVAELLQVHLVTVRRMIKAGQINAVHIGRNVRIPATEIDRLMSKGVAA